MFGGFSCVSARFASSKDEKFYICEELEVRLLSVGEQRCRGGRGSRWSWEALEAALRSLRRTSTP